MSDQLQSDSTPSGRTDTGVLAWLIWPLFLFLVVYPLSVAPAAKFVPNPPAFLHAVYTPLAYLDDHSQLVRSFYDWYAKLWGVHL